MYLLSSYCTRYVTSAAQKILLCRDGLSLEVAPLLIDDWTGLFQVTCKGSALRTRSASRLRYSVGESLTPSSISWIPGSNAVSKFPFTWYHLSDFPCLAL
jgi:hypothetical protein